MLGKPRGQPEPLEGVALTLIGASEPGLVKERVSHAGAPKTGA